MRTSELRVTEAGRASSRPCEDAVLQCLLHYCVMRAYCAQARARARNVASATASSSVTQAIQRHAGPTVRMPVHGTAGLCSSRGVVVCVPGLTRGRQPGTVRRCTHHGDRRHLLTPGEVNHSLWTAVWR